MIPTPWHPGEEDPAEYGDAPLRGTARCVACGRTYRVPWELAGTALPRCQGCPPTAAATAATNGKDAA